MSFTSRELEFGYSSIIVTFGFVSSNYRRAVEVHLAVDEIVI